MNAKWVVFFALIVVGCVAFLGMSSSPGARSTDAFQPQMTPTTANTAISNVYSETNPAVLLSLQNSRFIFEIAVTQFAGDQYVVINRIQRNTSVGLIYLRFFRIASQNEISQLDAPLARPLGYWDIRLTDLATPGASRFSSGGFADRNRNHLPDIPIWTYTGGTCCPRYMMLLELTPQGNYVNITPNTTDVSPAYFFDLDEDGVWEIQGIDKMGTGGFAPYLVRWFGWDGSRYTEVSTEHEDWYQPEIEPLLTDLSENEQCILLSTWQPDPFNVRQVLLHYYALGQLDTGWDEIQHRANWSECRPRLITQHKTEIVEFENWLQALRDGTLIDDQYSVGLSP